MRRRSMRKAADDEKTALLRKVTEKSKPQPKQQPDARNDNKLLEEAEQAKHCSCEPYSHFTHAGPFILGQQLSDAQFIDLDQFLAKRVGDKSPDRYYMLKIVTLPRRKEDETYSQRQAKLLVYNEYSVLSLLTEQEGVIHHHGLYMDYFWNTDPPEAATATPDGSNSGTNKAAAAAHGAAAQRKSVLKYRKLRLGNLENDDDWIHPCASQAHRAFERYLPADCPRKGRLMRRIILALDCFISHIYCSTVYPLPKLFSRFTTVNSEFENLQEYVKRYKIIPEIKALLIFKKIVNIIYDLHQKDIAHRDLRLENILFNHRNEKTILINFGLARYVINDKICICDHRGSSAYISPDVLRRRPYNPKASDCWALGIIFYTMLFGKFPFYAETFPELFKKINTGQFSIPPNVLVWKDSHEEQPLKSETHSIVIHHATVNIINGLIVTEAQRRMGIAELKMKLANLIEAKFKAKDNMESQKLISSGKCDSEELQVVPDIDLPQPNELQQSPDAEFDDSPEEALFDLRTIAKDAAAMITTSDANNGDVFMSEDPNLLPQTSQIFSAMYDSIEAALRNKRNFQQQGGGGSSMDYGSQSNCQHLHDHNYSQKDLYLSSRRSSVAESGYSQFSNYLQSPDFQVAPRFVPSIFSSSQHRFFARSGSSLYDSEHKNYTSLLLEKLETPHRKRYKSRNSFSKAGSSGAHFLRSPTFVRLGSKMAKSNFSVTKVDGDIRQLNESEMQLAQSFLNNE